MSKEDGYTPRGTGERIYRGDGEIQPLGGLETDNQTTRAVRISSAGAAHTLLTYVATDGLPVHWLPSEERWQDNRYAYNASDKIEYIGRSLTHNPGDSVAVWFIWKFSYNASDQVTRREGPLIGAWDNRTSLGWA